jgi:DNA-binding response OmpR family regulator
MTPNDPPASPLGVLVIEDDEAIREGLVDALGHEGYRALQARDAVGGTEAALRNGCDLVLLDLMLPGGDGYQIMQEIRRLRPELPVIIITARGREVDRVRGLRLGADDYVVKPFSVRELLARVEAVLRRASARRGDGARNLTTLPVRDGVADLARREVRFDDGTRCELSDREAALLAYLAGHADRVVSRQEILREVWRLHGGRTQTRTIDMHVVRLREKLRDTGVDARVIVTVRGKGYMFGTSGRYR